MPFDLDGAFRKAEDFLRRTLKPKAVQAAEERRRRRRSRAAGRRFRRMLLAGGTAGAGGAGMAMAVAPAAPAALAAAAVLGLVAGGAALLWPDAAPPSTISREELVELMLDAEAWLLDKREELPGRALPALDRIFERLDELHPHVPALEPAGTVAWDLRRLIADHLPRLIDAYASLPASVRDAEPELLPRLVDGLGTCNEELLRICREASAAHLHMFEVQNRFLETRYRDG